MVRAVAIANQAVQTGYAVTPFQAKGATAKFDGQRWTWRGRAPCGKGDLEVEVTLNPDGAVEKVEVALLTSIN